MSVRHAVQAPAAVVMIRPRHFRSNPDTVADNAFQTATHSRAATDIAQAAYAEVSRMAEQLQAAGVRVHLFEDPGHTTPDAVFPNNWFSTHSGGHVAVYPMFAPNRQLERRWDIIEMLKREYRVQDVIDYSGLERDQVFLEGTGAMVLDHMERVAYAVRSNRSDPVMLERFCTHFNFEPMVFDAHSPSGQPVYHTNVILCIGTEFALCGFDLIQNVQRRSEIKERLSANGRSLIELSAQQIAEFAGNALELIGTQGKLLAVSARGLRSYTAQQRAQLERHVHILPLQVPTIELAGGSVRCMLAGVHLTPR
jgi:hypothetical protein